MIEAELHWQVSRRARGDHPTLVKAQAVAKWLNCQHGGRGRWVYRGVTRPDGSHVVERAPNPDVDRDRWPE